MGPGANPYGMGNRGFDGPQHQGFGRGGPNGQRRPARDQEQMDMNQKRRRF